MSNIERRRKETDGIGTENQRRIRVIGDEMNRAFRCLSKKEQRSLREEERRREESPGNTKDSSGELGSVRF